MEGLTPEEQERIRLARERAAAAKQTLDAKQSAAEREAYIAGIEREARELEAMQAAVEAHGVSGVRLIRAGSGFVIVRRPHPAVFARFRDEGSFKTPALEKLVRGCLVHPDAAGLDALLEEAPGALDRMSSAVVELAGFTEQEVAEKP